MYTLSSAACIDLLQSILTSTLDVFLGRDTLVALTHTLAHTDTERQELHRRLRTRRHPSRAMSPIPSISVTLHQTGNSISHSMRGSRSLAPPPKLPPPPRRSSVSFAPEPAQPALPSRRSSPALKEPHWLSLPPIQTRSSSGKGGRRPTLNRARSSPQLTSFAAAGVSFSSFPIGPSHNAQAQAKTRRKDARKDGTPVLSVDREEWQSVYLSEEGSPTVETAPTTAITSDATPSLAPEPEAASTPQRPTLRKAKTLADLLRRVPSSPGPPLPIDPESTSQTVSDPSFIDFA